ncbi:phosphatase PAP2 family protein [Enterococcus sp. LJL90]
MKNKMYYQLAGSFALLIFAFLGYVVRFYPTWLTGFDNAVTAIVRSNYPNLNSFFLWITQFGNAITVIILALAIVFVLVRGKKYLQTLWLAANLILISGIANPLLKLFFNRQRPTLEHLVTETSLSFPSGHAVTSVILYGTIIFILPTILEGKKITRLLQILLGILILLIGASRIYLGVHFPSDILGGYMLGLAWLFFTYPLYDHQRFVWQFSGKQK